MKDNVRRWIVAVLGIAASAGLAMGIDFDQAAQGDVLRAVDGAWASGAALFAALAVVVHKFRS